MLILSVSGNSSYCVQMSFFLEIAALGAGLIHFRFWFHFPPKVQPYFQFQSIFGFGWQPYATFGHTFGLAESKIFTFCLPLVQQK